MSLNHVVLDNSRPLEAEFKDLKVGTIDMTGDPVFRYALQFGGLVVGTSPLAFSGAPNLVTVGLPAPATQAVIPVASKMRVLSFKGETEDGTTLVEIKVNGVTENTPQLTSRSVVLAQTAVAAGDVITIAYLSGTVTGMTSLTLYLESVPA